MIDEELYQQAADELNSDRRKAHIWARACALSQNDHDEARYLYTNLRVEELLAERAAGIHTAPDVDGTLDDATLDLDSTSFGNKVNNDFALNNAADASIDATLATSALSLSKSTETHDDSLLNDLADIDTPSQNYTTSQSKNSSINSTTTGSFGSDPLASDSEQMSPAEANYFNKHTSNQLDERNTDSRPSYRQGRDEDLDLLLDDVSTDLDDDSSFRARESASLIEEADHALTADFTDATGVEYLDWRGDTGHTAPSKTGLQRVSSPSVAAHGENRFTQELMRQADEMPGQPSDVVSSTDANSGWESDWQPSDKANVAAVGTAASIGASRYSNKLEKNRPPNNEADREIELPLDLTEGKSGAKYSVYKRNDSVQVVKEGVSWSALFFTLPYLIYRHLFGTAIVYLLMGLIIAAGLVFFGLNWLDTGSTASLIVKGCTLGFALLGLIGLVYLPFRDGNFWRRNKLERRGFELVAQVKAANPGKAISIARRASALD